MEDSFIGECPACGGELTFLGTLGKLEHFRCRHCGLNSSHEITSCQYCGCAPCACCQIQDMEFEDRISGGGDIWVAES